MTSLLINQPAQFLSQFYFTREGNQSNGRFASANALVCLKVGIGRRCSMSYLIPASEQKLKILIVLPVFCLARLVLGACHPPAPLAGRTLLERTVPFIRWKKP
jgi:hypothetical protein